MKNTLIKFLILLVLISVFLSGCSDNNFNLNSNNLDLSNYDVSQDSSNIQIDIINNSISDYNDTLHVKYTNNSNKEYKYSEKIHIEVFLDGLWYVLPLSNKTQWNKLEYILLPNHSYTDELPIGKYYSKLLPGKYRIIREFRDKEGNTDIKFVEFKIL